MPNPPSNHARKILRFGVFEVNLLSGELRKNGIKIRLQEQPYQILAALIERPGELITREELKQKVWAKETFVDFDHSLNTAVNKIREALGDSASTPRYIETIARRGYRFLAPVESIEQSKDTSQNKNASEATPMHAELEIPLPHRVLSRALFAVVQVMYLVFYLIALIHVQAIGPIVNGFLSERGSLVVVGLVLITGAAGIPLRCFLISGIGFDYRGLRRDFERLFLPVLLLDQLWALSPFLILPKIGLGAALAATAALLYVPFAERTLLRMIYLPE